MRRAERARRQLWDRNHLGGQRWRRGSSGRLCFSSGSSKAGNSGRLCVGPGPATVGRGGAASVSAGSGTSASGGGLTFAAGRSIASSGGRVLTVGAKEPQQAVAWCASRRQTVEPRAPAVGSRSARGARRPGTEGRRAWGPHVDGRSRRRRGRERGRRDERVWGIGDRGGGSERGGQRVGLSASTAGTEPASSSGMLVLGSGNAGATGSSGRLVFSSGTAAGGNSGEVLVGSGSTTGGCGGGVRASVGCSARAEEEGRSAGRRVEAEARAADG